MTSSALLSSLLEIGHRANGAAFTIDETERRGCLELALDVGAGRLLAAFKLFVTEKPSKPARFFLEDAPGQFLPRVKAAPGEPERESILAECPCGTQYQKAGVCPVCSGELDRFSDAAKDPEYRAMLERTSERIRQESIARGFDVNHAGVRTRQRIA